jgi:hypothetical protein
MKKNRLNRLEFLKNQPVRFWFYKPETEKTKPNPNKKKPSQTEKNREKNSSQTGKNQAKLKKLV